MTSVKMVFLVFSIMTLLSSSKAATITAASGSGNWGTGATWVGGVAPATSDDVVIPNGSTVSLDVSAKECKTLTIQTGGVLQAGGAATVASPFSFRINSSGTLQVDGTLGGSTATRHPSYLKKEKK